jgi:hypothetical protein
MIFRTILGIAFALATAMSASAAVNITSGHTRHMQCDAGACVPTGKNADLNVIDLERMLKNSDVTVYTGNGAVTIEVTAPLTWIKPHRLTLNAYSNVSFKAPVISQGSGGVTIVTDVLGQGGELRFFEGGSVSFWDTNSSLTIDGVSYTLMNSIPTLASAIAANPSGNYALANDYNAFVDGIYLHSPIPTTFLGKFEGLGHTVDNIKIQNSNIGSEEVGLFSRAETGSLIRDIHLTDLLIDVTGVADIGGLAGRARGTIATSSASGTISGGYASGGLTGENDGTITQSSAAVDLSNMDVGGGLASSTVGPISFSRATGSVSVAFMAGGLTAYSQGAITDSSAAGPVTIMASNGTAGGLLGQNNTGSVARCFATGNVTLPDGQAHKSKRSPIRYPNLQMGGLVGASNYAVVDSYATGNVSGVYNLPRHATAVGGLIGTEQLNSTVATSYSTGAPSVNRGSVGGAAGTDLTGVVSNDSVYWDTDTSGIDDPAQGAGNISFDRGIHAKTSDQLRSGLPKGFSPAVWGHNANINNGFPYLLTNPPP